MQSIVLVSTVILGLCSQALASADLLFITTSSPNGETPACFSEASYGVYGNPPAYAYAVNEECATHIATSFSSGSIVSLPEDDEERSLIWLQEAGVDDSIRGNQADFQTEVENMLAVASDFVFATTEAEEITQHRQTVLSSQAVANGAESQLGMLALYLSDTSALISIKSAYLAQLDLVLPRFVVPIALPTTPRSYLPVPDSATKRVKHILSGLTFSPDIAAILSSISLANMKNDIRHLTGEDGEGILSRHSFSQGAKVAADWIQGEFEKTGANCTQKPFLSGFAPNVICRYAGSENTTALVLLSGHYDSRGSFGSTRAPGGDDDGSGIIHLLSIARAIKENSVKFKENVELVAFAGEEQGLLGSSAYARQLRAENANITLMIQADMLAFHSPSEPIQLGLPATIGLPEAAYLVANVSKIYSPELTVGVTAACCSDHQSFNSEGFPATQVFERAGNIIDPMYHNSGDLSDRSGYDFNQVHSIAKVTFATILEAAGFSIEKDE